MGKSSRRKRSRSPRSHKRHKRDSSRDLSSDRRRLCRPDGNRSHSRETSFSDSLTRILDLLADQGNRIAAIEVNSHIPATISAIAAGDLPPLPTEKHHPADIRTPQAEQGNEVQRSQGSNHAPLQSQSSQPEEVRLG